MSRILPVFIDVIILVLELCIFAGYFYMAFIYKKLDAVDCIADINSDVPLVGKTQVGVNVTDKFKRAIMWGFWMTFSAFFRAILAQIGLCLKMWTLLWISYFIFAVNLSLFVMLFVFMNMWRFSHSGRVCSGDFYEGKRSINEDVYLVKEGMFLKIVILLVYLIMALALIAIFITVCIFARARNGEGDERESNRITAMTMAIDADYE